MVGFTISSHSQKKQYVFSEAHSWIVHKPSLDLGFHHVYKQHMYMYKELFG